MLTKLTFRTTTTPARQKGVVLLITLIMLVAMTLAAIALVRSVDTSTLVAGNLAFQQTALNSSDAGTEQAIAYLFTVPNIQCSSTGGLNPCPPGYKSWHEPLLEPSTPGRTWDDYWIAMQNNPGVITLQNLPAGYSGAFVIEAMCATNGQANCAVVNTTTSTTAAQGQDLGSQSRPFGLNNSSSSTRYYRLTTRVVGPHNSVGYVQAFIAL